ncbi:MAG: ABC transporter permease [Clostridiales bacterium]|nr:ABC transporter permease [Clostridiales bacterium]
MKTVQKTIARIWSNYSFAVIFVVILLFYIMVSNGLTWGGITNILRHSAVIGLISFGAGLVIITGEIDLSVGSMLAFVAGFSVVIFNATQSAIMTLLFALLCGAACGFINGVLVGVAKMPSFIVTLATMLIYRSLAQYYCQQMDTALTGGGNSLYKMSREVSSYDGLYGFGNGKFLTVPNVGWLLLLFVILWVYIATSTKFGKKIYAIGSNERSSYLVGINVALNRTVVFVLCGIMVGLASFLWICMNGSADPATSGSGYEMYAIAAVVLGGISMSGGKGRMVGILFGAMSYTIIDKIIVALKMDSLINDTIKGVILIVAILVQTAGPEIRASLHSLRRK